MKATREKNANCRILDFLQFIFIKHRIRKAKKQGQNHILYWDVVRPNIFNKFQKLGYRVFAQGGDSGYTWFFW